MQDFELLPEIPIDPAHTLEQVTSRFATVGDGLPELIKNSKDQYSRLGIHDRSDRQIVVIANSKKKNIAVLDFAGAGPEDFAGWKTWSSRVANRAERSADIEGGHGNGGKAFMVRGSIAFSYMDSCSEGRRTKMGFRNEDPAERYIPGYAREDGKLINNVPDLEPRRRLASVLRSTDCRFQDLPTTAREVFERRDAFTAVVVHGIRDWQQKRPSTVRRLVRELADEIARHGQAALTVATCDVWGIADGELITAEPAKIRLPEPYAGFENLAPIPVPQTLVDPLDDEEIDTGPGDADTKYLLLRTSSKHLRMSDDLKGHNVIRIWNDRNNVATWPLASLDVLLPTTAFICGEFHLPALTGEHLGDPNRITLADTPLTRAIARWVSQQVADLAQQISRVQARETRPEDREKAKRTLSGFRALMRKYLEPETMPGDEDDDSTGNGRHGQDRGRRGTRVRSSGTRIDEVALEPTLQRVSLAMGTRIPIVFRCYEIQEDGSKKPVRDSSATIHSSDPAIASPGPDGTLDGLTNGSCEIWIESATSGKASNRIPVEVIKCTDVDILAPEDPLLQGQRLKLPVLFHTAAGHRDDLLVQATVDEPNMAWIGRHGFLTAGLQQGTATIRVRFGSDASQQRVATITIGPERMQAKGYGGDSGGNIPEILLCGDEAPGMDAYPPEQRTHEGGEHYPTIIEEPQFPHVVWINHSSKEASRVRRSRGGPIGMARIATPTFMHFVALKCFDVLKRLKVRQELHDQTVNETQFCQLIAQAEMDCASFIDAAYDLSEELLREAEEA